jgi:hypothetical protein
MTESNVVTALNRLQRAGSENSRATAKLREAAVVVADVILQTAPRDVELPRGYVATRQYSNVGSFLQFRNAAGETLNSESKIPGEHYLHGDFNRTWVNVDREGLQQFAADIADGLLDEIAAFIEAQTAQAETAAANLEAAKV